jgi:Protein of unknown function (DUF3501).
MTGEVNMGKITAQSLWTLEHYARIRNQFRAEVMAHKNIRRIALGEHVSLLFEDEKTIRYQIQEMLRIEKTFEVRASKMSSMPTTPWCPMGVTSKPP